MSTNEQEINEVIQPEAFVHQQPYGDPRGILGSLGLSPWAQYGAPGYYGAPYGGYPGGQYGAYPGYYGGYHGYGYPGYPGYYGGYHHHPYHHGWHAGHHWGHYGWQREGHFDR